MIVIPDDPAELAREAVAVRRELRRFARRNRWRRRLHRPPLTESASAETPSLGLPVLIMAIALAATLTSLFALAWPGSTVRPAASSPPRAPAPVLVPDLTLFDAAGKPLHLRNNLPAVLLLADGCDCIDLELATAQAVASSRVTVLVIGRLTPPLPTDIPTGLRLIAASDPEGALRSIYAGTPPADGLIAVLVKGTGEVIRTARSVIALAAFQADLPKLMLSTGK